MKYTCSCGGGDGPKHSLGEGKCFRMLATENLIPTNFRYISMSWKEPERKDMEICDVNGHEVTVFDLKNSRMYSQNEDGTWTMPKSKESVKSL